MEYDKDKVDDMVLALLYLNTFDDEYGKRAWKEIAWEVSNRLFDNGYIGNPRGKAESVVLTDEGVKLSESLFFKFFGIKE